MIVTPPQVKLNNWQARQGRGRAPAWPFILAGALLLVAILQGGYTLFGQDAEEGVPIAAGGDQLRVSQGVIIFFVAIYTANKNNGNMQVFLI